MDDRELLSRIAEGDEQAFSVFFRKEWRNIYSQALAYLKSAERAEEVTQDIFIRLWDTRQNLKGILHVDNYLFIIARNALVSEVRKKVTRFAGTDDMHAADITLQPDRQAEYKEQYQLLMRGIEKLPQKRREVFRLSRIEGLTHAEIAERLGINKDTVAQYIVKALDFLKPYLSRQVSNPIILLILLGGA